MLTFRRGQTVALTARDTGTAGVATFRFGGGGALRAVIAERDGSLLTCTVPADMTAAMPAGIYDVEVTVVDGEVTRIVDTGQVRVQRSLLTDEYREAEGRTWAEQRLAEVEAVIADAMQSGDLSISVGGQSIQFESRGDLLRYRAQLRREVERERRAAALGVNLDRPMRVRI